MTAHCLEHLPDETLGRPVGQRDRAAGTGYPQQLRRRLLGPRREHDAVHAYTEIERRITIRQCLGVPFIEPDLESFAPGSLPGLHNQIAGKVDAATGSPLHQLTEAGEDLRPVIMAMGTWGQRWLEAQLSLKNLDPSLLMWDMRRNLNPDLLPSRRVTIQFLYHDVAEWDSKRCARRSIMATSR